MGAIALPRTSWRKPGLVFAVSLGAARLRAARPRPDPPPGHPGLPQAAAPGRRPGRARAAELRRPADRRPRRPRGSRHRQAAGVRDEDGRRVTRDYLFLAFKGDDRLYVPHEQIAKVSRYVGADGHAPALSKLGGKAWQAIKNRARAGARALAGELLVLYAQRQRAEGVAFAADNELVERLEAGFPYEETPDQQQAIEVVKEDLEAPRPMDRLVCGDVGYGKTEVAVRWRSSPWRTGRRRSCRAHDDPRATALEHVSGSATAISPSSRW